ncbi:hypothetical protein [Halorhodospira halochloris]|uniref:hypothetical protein n=1 Tax=Halorhodospira halochloris TaxID=1052 RepID=UPI00076F8295|nr:hypothetical protein [Halorhodospira halochloris]
MNPSLEASWRHPWRHEASTPGRMVAPAKLLEAPCKHHPAKQVTHRFFHSFCGQL